MIDSYGPLPEGMYIHYISSVIIISHHYELIAIRVSLSLSLSVYIYICIHTRIGAMTIPPIVVYICIYICMYTYQIYTCTVK